MHGARSLQISLLARQHRPQPAQAAEAAPPASAGWSADDLLPGVSIAGDVLVANWRLAAEVKVAGSRPLVVVAAPAAGAQPTCADAEARAPRMNVSAKPRVRRWKKRREVRFTRCPARKTGRFADHRRRYLPQRHNPGTKRVSTCSCRTAGRGIRSAPSSTSGRAVRTRSARLGGVERNAAPTRRVKSPRLRACSRPCAALTKASAGDRRRPNRGARIVNSGP